MEDACQFTERLTEHKYKGSNEQIAKALLIYTQNPLFDVVRFYEQVIVSFLIGNNDMHLKKISLISYDRVLYTLAPAYDMISAQLLLPVDPEELALALNGKKRKISRADFNIAMLKAHIPKRAIENLWDRIAKGTQEWPELVQNSFIENDNKKRLLDLITIKRNQLKLG